MSRPVPKVLDGNIFKVIDVNSKENVMTLEMVSSGPFKDRIMKIIGTGAHRVGQYLWMTRTNGDEKLIQNMLEPERTGP